MYTSIIYVKVKKVKRYSSPEQIISELRVSLAIMWSHSVTCHPEQANTPLLTPARQAGIWFTYPQRGGQAELTWMAGYIPRLFIRPQTVTHPSTNPAAHGRESNSQPVDYKCDALTIQCHQKYFRSRLIICTRKIKITYDMSNRTLNFLSAS